MDLKNLSNADLEMQLKFLVKQEREVLHDIILHLQEVQRRRLYFENHPSLFDYLTKDLGYSAGAAQRRIDAARLVEEIPTVVEKIKTGSLHLTQISLLQRSFRLAKKQQRQPVEQKTKEQLAEKIQNLGQRDSELLVAKTLNLTILQGERIRTQKDGSVRLELSFNKEQWARLNEAKCLVAHALIQNRKRENLTETISAMVEFYLKKKQIFRPAAGE